jgi:hypothetical protein
MAILDHHPDLPLHVLRSRILRSRRHQYVRGPPSRMLSWMRPRTSLMSSFWRRDRSRPRPNPWSYWMTTTTRGILRAPASCLVWVLRLPTAGGRLPLHPRFREEGAKPSSGSSRSCRLSKGSRDLSLHCSLCMLFSLSSHPSVRCFPSCLCAEYHVIPLHCIIQHHAVLYSLQVSL